MSKQFTYTLKMDAEIGDLISKVEQAKASMAGLAKTGKFPGIEKSFNSIEKALGKIQETAKTPITSAATFGSLQKDVAAVQVQLQGLEKIIANVMALPDADKMKFLPPELEKTVSGLTAALSTFSTALETAEQKTAELLIAEKNLAEAKKKLAGAQNKQAEAQQRVNDEQGRIDAKKEEIKVIKEQIKVLEDYQAMQKLYEEAGARKNRKFTDESGTTHSLPKAKNAAKKVAADIGIDISSGTDAALEELNSQLEEQEKALGRCEAAERKYQGSLNSAISSVSAKQAQVDALTTSLDELNTEFEKNKAQKVQVAFNALRRQAEALGVSLEDIPVDYTKEAFEQLEQRMQQASLGSFQAFNNEINQAETNLGQLGDAASTAGDKFAIAADEFQEGNEKFKNTTAIIERIRDFVGLKGGIEIARAAMRNAIATIKELDAVMTEMSVVTDLSVGDYWKQLPEHTTQANELGVAISEVYKAETLYYQQGLKTNEVTAMSTETLKMARIAGLSAEDATNKMTAALRGFNMELNETSAQKVADVYSELAAITASDVNEISSAMTKTASIASSAGMEFETTAAFLSQIIETTRESAETAGTAMKTVIARFQELKKDPAEIGEVDGEIVDANAIETALRSVGVSLRDTNGQFRELDDVFLELSGKWDSLDKNTQRYIATIAAGSRQQSRFIAMMSDYNRTQELVAAANNSTGASNEQFEKTLDSLESKLAKLKNAWDSFTMGIMNSEIIKMGVDLLTKLLEVLNNISAFFDQFGLGGAASIGMVVAALYLGDKAIKIFMASLKSGSTVFQAFGATGRAAIDSIHKRFVVLRNLFSKKISIKLDNKNLSKATEAVKRHQQATDDLKNVEQNRIKTAREGNLTDAAAAKYNQEAADAKKARTMATEELATATGLSAAQTETFLGFSAMELGTDKALLLTKAGLTAKNFEHAASLFGVEAATIAAVYAEKLENASGIKALLLKGSLTASTWLYNIAKKAETAGILGGIPAKIADIAANWGMQASMWPILVIGLLLIVALGTLALIILAVVAAVKAFQENSPEGKLKSAEEATKAAAEAADRAAEAYENLTESLNGLQDKYKALQELTRGTEEWNNAIAETNAEVLALIEKYPELAEFVDSSDGYLKLDIESDEVQSVLDKYEKKSAAATAASYAAKINVNEKKADVRADKISDENAISIGDTYAYLNDATLIKMANAMKSGELTQASNSAEIANWIKENGTGTDITYAGSFAAALADDIDALAEFGNELYAMSEQERVYRQAMADAAYSAIDLEKYSTEQQKQMETAATAEFSTRMVSAREAEFQAALDSKDSDTINDAKEEVAKNLYGEDATVSGNTITYTDDSGEEQTKKLTDEEFKEQWAALEATKDMTAALESVPSRIAKVTAALNTFSTGLGKAYNSLISNPKQTTKKDAQTAKNAIGTDAYKQDMYATWLRLSEAERDYYQDDIALFMDEFEKAAEEVNRVFEGADKRLQQAGGKDVEVSKSMTGDNATAYADDMANLALGLGKESEAIKNINGYINELANNLPEDEFNQFMAQFNAIDLSNLNDWKALETTLTTMGLESVVTSDSFKNLAAEAQKAAGAIERVDLNKFAETFREVQDFVGRAQKGEIERTFESEDYEKFIKGTELEADFVMNNDGSFTYLGDNMQTLASAILENTEVQRLKNIEQTKDTLLAQDIADKLGKDFWFSNGDSMDLGNASSWDPAQQRNYIQTIVNGIVANKGNVSSLGVYGMTNETNIDALNNASDADIEKTFKELVAVLSDSSIEGKLKQQEKLQQAAMFNQNIYANAGLLRSTTTGMSKASTEDTEGLLQRTQAILKQAIDAGIDDSAIDAYNDKITALQEILNTEYKNEEERAAAIEALDLGPATDSLMEAVDAAEALNKELSQWKTEFGFLDQISRQISQSQREQEKIERAYQRILEDEQLSQEEILRLTQQQAQELNKNANLSIQQWANSAEALRLMTDKNGQNKEFAQYVNYDAETGEVQIDYQAAEKAIGTDSEKGALFDEYVSDVYEIKDAVDEAQDNLEEIEDQMDELKDRGKDDYSELWNDVREALIKNQQRSIDKLSEVNDSIEEAESSLIDQIQKQIEEQRQARENEKAMQELGDKEAQMAYLMRDTSGANAMAALDLQLDIENSKEDMTDQLVDQAIANMQDANEQAALQRQQQIDIAQAQLDVYTNSQQSWLDAQMALNYALSNEGALGLGLTNLGFNLGMLLGPEGDLALNLATLLGTENNLNTIEQAAFEQQVASQMENATIYAALNDQLIDNDSNNTEGLLILGQGIDLQFATWGLKADTLSGTTNSSIVSARDEIVNEVGGAITAAGGDQGAIATGISGLLPKEEEKTALENIVKGETFASQAKKFAENTMFKNYEKDLKALNEQTKATQLAQQQSTLTNLINDTTGSGLSEKEFNKLKESGALSGTASYADYKDRRQKNVDMKTAQTKSYADIGSIAAAVGGKGESSDDAGGQKYIATVYKTKFDDTVGAGVLDTVDLDAGAKDSAYMDLGIGKKEWATFEGRMSSQAENFARLNVSDGQIFMYEGEDYVQEWGVKKGNKAYKLITSSLNSFLALQTHGVLKEYKTGGLADFTGPAWLDGTKAHPEMVLNARDTENFIQLKNILADILEGAGTMSKQENNKTNQVNSFDIDINVENIGDDYDVEQLADKIREILYDDSMYRNVNNITLTR